jgi:hypothetical protein
MATIVQRSQEFAHKGLALIESQGECLTTARWLVEEANRITDSLSDRTLKKCEYAGGVLDVSTAATINLWGVYAHPKEWNDPETRLAEGWAEVRMILRELAGLDPIRTHARDREEWTQHWKDLYERGDEAMKRETVKTAKQRYPDFDLSLIGVTEQDEAISASLRPQTPPHGFRRVKL